jgi:hypothetical protein
MGLFGKKKGSSDKAVAVGPPVDPHWVKSPVGKFYKFNSLDPEDLGLEGQSAVFVVWHAGVRPGWVYVAQTGDLAKALHAIAKEDDIMQYDIRGGLYVTWSLIKTEFQNGVVRYLTDSMDLLVPNPNEPGMKITPVPVFAPGMEPKKPVLAPGMEPKK